MDYTVKIFPKLEEKGDYDRYEDKAFIEIRYEGQVGEGNNWQLSRIMTTIILGPFHQVTFNKEEQAGAELLTLLAFCDAKTVNYGLLREAIKLI